MAPVSCVLLLATACFSLAASQCEVGVVNSIKALRKGIDDSKVLNIVGDWGLVYVAGSSAVPGGFSTTTCQVSNFYFKDGKHQVGHNGVLAGAYILKYKNGAELVIDPKTKKVLRKTYIVYTSPDYSVVGYYSCSVSGPKVSVGSVLVKTSEIGSAATDKLVIKAEEALFTVGLKYGEPITACYTNVHTEPIPNTP